MNAKQIELQVEANQKESIKILRQLLSAGDSFQRQQLNNRLAMLNRSQTYWANEYSRLTGNRLNVSPTPTPTPAQPAPQTSFTQNKESWQQKRENIRKSLAGNPNLGRVESFLNTLESGNGTPKISGNFIFGKATPVFQNERDFNGQPAAGSYQFEDAGTVLLFGDGTVLVPAPGLLVCVYPYHEQNDRTAPTPKIEFNRPDLVKGLQALRGR